jgi:hypothetical protein
MKPWTIQPRDVNLVRSYDPVRFWSELVVVERHNVLSVAPGTWSVTAQNEGLDGMFTPGNGVILFRGSDEIMSGPITSIQRGAKVSTISGVSDTDLLNDPLAFPNPSQPITAQTSASDNRSGAGEDVILGYVGANMGPSARTDRQNPLLRLGTTSHAGSPVSITGRLDMVGSIVSDVAESAGLHYDIIHQEDSAGPFLLLRISGVVDRSANVRFGTLGSFTGATVGFDWSYTLARPTVTRSIAAGTGTGTSRIFVQQIDSAAEALWGARIEHLVDQSGTSDTPTLTQAAADDLAGGSAPVNITFTISDSPDVKYRRDWFVGDTVFAQIDGLDLTAPVREVTTTVSQQAGSRNESVQAVVGSRDASAWVDETNKDVGVALAAIDKLKAV